MPAIGVLDDPQLTPEATITGTILVRVFAEPRRQRILRRLKRDGSVRVAALAREWQLNPITVRRDLDLLAEQKLLRRVHGGALAFDPADANGLRIGLLVPHTDYYYGKVVRGAEQAAGLLGVRLVLATYFYREELEHERFEQLSELRLDGLVLTPSGLSRGAAHEQESEFNPRPYDDFVESLRERNLPTVFLERHPHPRLDGTADSVVRSAHDQGALIALHHLHQLGHRRVCAVLAPTPTVAGIREGLDAGAERLGIEVIEGPLVTWPRKADIKAAARFCRDSGIRAVLAHSDHVGIGLVTELSSLGLEVPRDVHVITYDDEIAEQCQVPLTAVSPAKEALGYEAVRVVTEQLDSGTPATPRQVIITPYLVVRDSAPPVS